MRGQPRNQPAVSVPKTCSLVGYDEQVFKCASGASSFRVVTVCSLLTGEACPLKVHVAQQCLFWGGFSMLLVSP